MNTPETKMYTIEDYPKPLLNIFFDDEVLGDDNDYYKVNLYVPITESIYDKFDMNQYEDFFDNEGYVNVYCDYDIKTEESKLIIEFLSEDPDYDSPDFEYIPSPEEQKMISSKVKAYSDFNEYINELD